MAQEQLNAFVSAIRANRAFQEQLSTTQAADADEVSSVARAAGFEVSPKDLVSFADGLLVEYVEEDFFMKPFWWTLIEA